MSYPVRRATLMLGVAFALGTSALSCGKTAVCGAENRTCEGATVDVGHDVNNCGGCGNHCAGGATCECGQCSCPSGEEVCAGACVKLSTDPAHCGTCRSACPAGFVCRDRQCACGEGRALCDGSCVDLERDGRNCGACGNACLVGLSCVSGQCSCLPGSRCSLGPGTDGGADAGTDGGFGTDAGSCKADRVRCNGFPGAPTAGGCCSGYCDAQSFCDTPPAGCRFTGASCGRDAECCSLACTDDTDAGLGRCELCRAGGESCSSPSAAQYCCSNYCDPTQACAAVPPCRPTGGSCREYYECCSSACSAQPEYGGDGGTGVCLSCLGTLKTCTQATAQTCCSGYCGQIGCLPEPACRPLDDVCGRSSQCCSLACSDNSDAGTGTCRADAGPCNADGASCGSPQNCCSGYCPSGATCLASPWSACVNRTGSYNSCQSYCASLGRSCSNTCTTHGGGANSGAEAYQGNTNCSNSNAGATYCGFIWNDAVGDPARWRCCCL